MKIKYVYVWVCWHGDGEPSSRSPRECGAYKRGECIFNEKSCNAKKYKLVEVKKK